MAMKQGKRWRVNSLQVGLRRTTEDFDRMPYLADLAPKVQNQIMGRIKMIRDL